MTDRDDEEWPEPCPECHGTRVVISELKRTSQDEPVIQAHSCPVCVVQEPIRYWWAPGAEA